MNVSQWNCCNKNGYLEHILWRRCNDAIFVPKQVSIQLFRFAQNCAANLFRRRRHRRRRLAFFPFIITKIFLLLNAMRGMLWDGFLC